MLAPGDRVGPYTALFRLGKGGMGEVWAAARQQADVGFTKLFALKVLARERVGENDALMFYDEAKAASALQHPSIVSTLELGQAEGVLYIAMDLVRGPSLTALLQRLVIHESTLPPTVVALIGVRIGQALDYAYERAHLDGKRLRLIHRDVSPHNVLIDTGGSVRLTDFGVARTAVQDHRSRVGTIRGKPSYMAPEQVAGAEIDSRTDVFALGIVLYECACLKRLFGRKNPVKSMDAVISYHPKPLTEMVPGFPKAISDVIGRALEKTPGRRFPTAGAFAAALEDAARDLPDWPSAERELLARIDAVFEPGAFDVDGRARESLEIASRREARDGLLAEVRPVDVEGPDAGRTTVWPQAPDPDPLAPEAIEELRTQLRPGPGVSSPSLSGPSLPMLVPASGSYTGVEGSASGVRPPPRRWLTGLVGVAGMLALVAVGLALGRRAAPSRELEPIAPTPSSRPPARGPSIEARPAPVARSTPFPRADVHEAPASERALERRTAPTPDAPKEAKARARTTPIRSAPAPEPPPSEGDATYAEVQDLLRKVRVVDPDRGRAMLATLIEAGRANTATLNRLRAEARRILAELEPPSGN